MDKKTAEYMEQKVKEFRDSEASIKNAELYISNINSIELNQNGNVAIYCTSFDGSKVISSKEIVVTNEMFEKIRNTILNEYDSYISAQQRAMEGI